MTKTARKERHIWLDTMITLVALELMSYFYYGMRAVVLGGVCISVSLITEIICLRFMNRRFTADDLTCTSDALIIALMMPATMDYGIAGIACIFAVVAAKNVFGGRRNIIFSPAAAAYIFMLTSWEKKLLLYPQPHVQTGIFDEPETLVNSASYVYNTTGKMEYTDFELLMGNFSGPAGSVSILLLIISAAMLIFRRDISAGAFTGTIIGTAFLSYIVPASPTAEIGYTFATNMVLFAAVYIISDRRVAPKRGYFAFFYGLFIAVFSYVIVITTGKENAIVIVSVLFTPIALGIKNLEKKIELADAEVSEEKTAAAEADSIAAENDFSEEKTEDTSNE